MLPSSISVCLLSHDIHFNLLPPSPSYPTSSLFPSSNWFLQLGSSHSQLFITPRPSNSAELFFFLLESANDHSHIATYSAVQPDSLFWTLRAQIEVFINFRQSHVPAPPPSLSQFILQSTSSFLPSTSRSITSSTSPFPTAQHSKITTQEHHNLNTTQGCTTYNFFRSFVLTSRCFDSPRNTSESISICFSLTINLRVPVPNQYWHRTRPSKHPFAT